jgi:hypothetical protein
MAYDRIDLYVGLLDAIDTSVAFDASRAILSPAEKDPHSIFNACAVYLISGTPFVVKRCIFPSRRTGRRVPAALPVPGG